MQLRRYPFLQHVCYANIRPPSSDYACLYIHVNAYVFNAAAIVRASTSLTYLCAMLPPARQEAVSFKNKARRAHTRTRNPIYPMRQQQLNKNHISTITQRVASP